MIILKWYSIIWLSIGLLSYLYQNGKEGEPLTAFLGTLFTLPIIIFLILV